VRRSAATACTAVATALTRSATAPGTPTNPSRALTSPCVRRSAATACTAVATALTRSATAPDTPTNPSRALTSPCVVATLNFSPTRTARFDASGEIKRIVAIRVLARTHPRRATSTRTRADSRTRPHPPKPFHVARTFANQRRINASVAASRRVASVAARGKFKRSRVRFSPPLGPRRVRYGDPGALDRDVGAYLGLAYSFSSVASPRRARVTAMAPELRLLANQ